jgi:hypothetical protein
MTWNPVWQLLVHLPIILISSCLDQQVVRFYFAPMNTVAEIEAAIERLPSGEQAELRHWLLERTATKPKTGAELAALWTKGFHLTIQEADDFARDLEASQQATKDDYSALR